MNDLRWANRPRVAEDLFGLTIDAGKLRRGSCGFQNRDGFLSLLSDFRFLLYTLLLAMSAYFPFLGDVST